MCGIAGFVDPRGPAQGELAGTAATMAETIRHRGPDDGGVWADDRLGVALAARRLAVIDLSEHGHQPMPSDCGRYVLVFNGEIYNFRELRKALERLGHPFRGSSDTEVMLAAISHWGVDSALERFNGMFAFALWDRERRELRLARDRMGEKPLYYGHVGGVSVFGSELKALRAHPAFKPNVDRNALSLYLRYGYVPGPFSIYENIRKLPPGTSLTLTGDAGIEGPRPFWSLHEVAQDGMSRTFRGSEEDAVDELEATMREAVGLRMEADVPLGAFLSGGIDSSTVVALMQAESGRPVKTFALGFEVPSYNEADHALAVARHLDTDHTELRVSPEDARRVIPSLPSVYDEPFADGAQIATCLVSELARREVTVSLSGDGGDELFGGYNRHVVADGIWRRSQRVPAGVRRKVADALTAVPTSGWNALSSAFGGVVPRRWEPEHLGDRIDKLASVLSAANPDDMYLRLVSQWHDTGAVVQGSTEPTTVVTDPRQWPSLPEIAERMMFLDCMSYLPDDNLARVDRASMAVSLEARVPLLDHRVVELAWRMPLSLKVRDHRGKWLMRRLLGRYLPNELFERPKMGFGVPIDTWLRGPLQAWSEELLDEERLSGQGFFDPAPIRRRWSEHISRRRNWDRSLWTILMFQSWLEQTRADGPSGG